MRSGIVGAIVIAAVRAHGELYWNWNCIYLMQWKVIAIFDENELKVISAHLLTARQPVHRTIRSKCNFRDRKFSIFIGCAHCTGVLVCCLIQFIWNFIKFNFNKFYLIIGSLFPNLFKTLFNTAKTWCWRGCVHQQKCMCRCYWQSSHCRKLHVAGCIQYVHLSVCVSAQSQSIREGERQKMCFLISFEYEFCPF